MALFFSVRSSLSYIHALYFTYVLNFTYLLSPPLECKLHSSKSICFIPLSYPSHREQWLTYRKVNEWCPAHDHYTKAHISAPKGNLETIKNGSLRLILLLMFQFWYVKVHKTIQIFFISSIRTASMVSFLGYLCPFSSYFSVKREYTSCLRY